MRALLLALCLSGCYQVGPFPTFADQPAIMHYIWVERFEMKDEAPQVEWITQNHLDCGPGPNGHNVAFMAEGICVYGITVSYDYYVRVAHPIDFSWGDSALTHELNHERLLTKGILYGDPEHKDPSFQQGGLVNQIQSEIRARWN